jgi:hypothetical protein
MSHDVNPVSCVSLLVPFSFGMWYHYWPLPSFVEAGKATVSLGPEVNSHIIGLPRKSRDRSIANNMEQSTIPELFSRTLGTLELLWAF